MNIFITGGSGFVGSALIPELVKNGNHVYALARSQKSADKVRSLGAVPITGNLEDIHQFKHALDKMDTVIHAAAKLEMWGSYDDFYRINVAATKNLIDVSVRMGVKRFIYISAGAVVLDGEVHGIIDEKYSPRRLPTDNYSKTKALAEKAVLERSGEIQTVVIRPPFVWGPAMPMIEEYRATIEKMGFPTIGRKDHITATCHVRNLAAAVTASLQSEKSGSVYFITDGETMPLRIFIRKLAHAYGLDTGTMVIPRWLALAGASISEFFWGLLKLKGPPPVTKTMVNLMGTELILDDSKARHELGYGNVLSIEEGLREIITHNYSSFS